MKVKMAKLQVMHVGVYGVLLKKDRLLVIEKARGPYIGLFDLPGGWIEHGESPADTLVREVEEETGVVAVSWEFFDHFTYTGSYVKEGEEKSFHHLGLVYHVTEFRDSGLKLDICEEDVLGAAWISLNKSDAMTPFVKRVCCEFAGKICEPSMDRNHRSAKKNLYEENAICRSIGQ